MNYDQRDGDRGVSLLEVIASLLIGAPLLLIVARTFTVSTAQYIAARALRVEIETSLTIKGLLTAMIEHSASHRLPIVPRIHLPGILTFVDGTHHTVNNHPLYRPQSNSTPFSALELDLDRTLIVQGILINGARQICPRWGTPPDRATRLFLAVSIDGMTPVQGTLLRLPQNSRCFSLTPEPVPSTVLPTQESIIPFASLFVPIKREYTVYLATTGELRYLGHRGFITTENQPLLRGVKQLFLSSYPPTPLHPLRINAQIKSATERSWSLSLASPVTPRALPTFLAIRP